MTLSSQQVQSPEAAKFLAGKTAVIKFGGTSLQKPALRDALIAETINLAKAGVKVVVVHGGGPTANEALAKMNIPTKKVEGVRITDEVTLRVVVDVFTQINKELVAAFEAKGAKAVAVSGGHTNVFLAKKLELKDKEGHLVDLGWVGDVQLVDLFAVGRTLESGYIPVIAPIGMDNDGHYYNLNADHAALAIAAALKADNLVFLTDVPGILKNVQDPLSRIAHMSLAQIQEYVGQGIIAGGMLPKVKGCAAGIEKGIRQIAIMDGHAEQAILQGIINPQAAGTLITGTLMKGVEL